MPTPLARSSSTAVAVAQHRRDTALINQGGRAVSTWIEWEGRAAVAAINACGNAFTALIGWFAECERTAQVSVWSAAVIAEAKCRRDAVVAQANALVSTSRDRRLEVEARCDLLRPLVQEIANSQAWLRGITTGMPIDLTPSERAAVRERTVPVLLGMATLQASLARIVGT